MGIEEDKAELFGTNYDRLLFAFREGSIVKSYLVSDRNGNWSAKNQRPNPGKGEYIEKHGKECRLYSNREGNLQSYRLV